MSNKINTKSVRDYFFIAALSTLFGWIIAAHITGVYFTIDRQDLLSNAESSTEGVELLADYSVHNPQEAYASQDGNGDGCSCPTCCSV